MGFRPVLIRVAVRCVLMVSAVLFVFATGAVDERAPSPPARAATAAPVTATTGEPASSAYSLQTEGGPRSARMARVVAGMMLLTGLALTALSSIGTKGPALLRREEPVSAEGRTRTTKRATVGRYGEAAETPRVAAGRPAERRDFLRAPVYERAPGGSTRFEWASAGGRAPRAARD